MRVFQLLKSIIGAQLLAVVPPEYDAAYRARQFSNNILRFSIQSMVVMAMNSCSLLYYLSHYRSLGSYRMGHIGTHIAIIAVMGCCVAFFFKKTAGSYRPDSFLDRNLDLLYPALHMVCEYALFCTGPQDLGAFIRLSAVAFVIGSIPLIKQSRGFVLEIVFYTIYTGLTYFAVPYSGFVLLSGMLLNVWLVVFPCANFLSFTVYSWSVTSFVNGESARRAQENLSSLNDHLTYASQRDQMTTLLNRRGFQERMDADWEQYKHLPGTTATAIMMDIDYFKLYNDRFGHLAGDKCLIHVARRIAGVLGEDYICARYGGEEFIAVAFNKSHDDTIQTVELLRQEIEELAIEHPDSDISPYVTICAGVATQRLAEMAGYDDLVKMADECLYFAKNNGRNQMAHTQNAPFNPPKPDDQEESLLNLYSQLGELDTDYMQRVLKDVSADCTFVYNSRNRRLEFSKSASDIFDLPSNIIHPTVNKIANYIPIVPSDRENLFNRLHQALSEREPFLSEEVRLLSKSGKTTMVALRAQCVYRENGSLEIVYGSVFSMQKILEYNQFLQQRSYKSTITQLPNRQKFHSDLAGLLQDEHNRGYLIYIDIVHFKDINGTYSHNIGDKVLRETAFHLSRLAGTYAPVYNYSVDQFIIVANGASHSDAEGFMKEISSYFAAHNVNVDRLDVQINFAMVAVKFAGGVTTPDNALIDLDIAIRVAKYKPDHPYSFFTKEDREKFLVRMNLSNTLKKSMDDGFQGFAMFYQPIIDAANGTCVGAEALLRWFDSDGNMVMPIPVISIMEKSGMMPVLEEWIFKTGCKQCRDWLDMGFPDDFFININLSSACIGRPRLFDEITDAMKQHSLSLHNIVLETTESAAILDTKSAVNTLDALRKHGLRIAIDDFGTGYSSLSYLDCLPADIIKIARSFITNVDSNSSRKDFLASIVGMAKSMGYQVCLEGVETPGESESLKSLPPVDYYQGFYYGRPLPPKEFASLFFPSMNQPCQNRLAK